METLTNRQKLLIMLSVVAVLMFSALNMTIVGTSLPKIVSSIGGMDYFDWVFTIYMLTSSITAILVGKLSDIYGRKIFILAGIIIFSVGSLLSGFSTSIMQLIIFRGIQGLGGGMLMSTAFATVGDLFSPRDRGRWQGVLGGTFGVASLFGPTLGGFIVDNFHWSWVFWVFLPFGIVAFIAISKLYPSLPQKEKEPIDYLGSSLLTIFIVTLLLGFSWGGTDYAWASPMILGLFATSGIMFGLFIFTEMKVQSPVVPLHLFKNSVFSISNIVAFFMGMGMFSVIMYVPFFVQGVLGKPATVSGLVEMAMTITMVIASAFAGNLVTKTGKYKWLGVIGLFIMTVGILLHAFLTPESSLFTLIIYLIVVGIGLGFTFPVFNVTVQNAVKHKFLGVATATAQLSRELGGTIGVAIMGALMSSLMARKLTSMEDTVTTDSERLPDVDSQVLLNPEQLDQIRESLPENVVPVFQQLIVMMREALNFSLNGVFVLSAALVGCACIIALFLKEIPLRKTNTDDEEVEEDQKPSKY